MNSPDTVPQGICRTARSPAELFPLIDFCRAGKLKEVGEWIAAGKPLDPPKSMKKRSRRRQSPLDVAIEKGFFTARRTKTRFPLNALEQANVACWSLEMWCLQSQLGRFRMHL